MSITRRLETITKRFAEDGRSLVTTEYTFYVQPETDPENPDLVFRGQQHCTIDHTESASSDSNDPRAKRAHGDLTAGQKTGVASAVTNDIAILNHLIPLNPGP